MAVEAMRACGYRKAGGLYAVADGPGFPCDRLPFPLHVCPTCSGGIKQSRSYAWLAPEFFGQHLLEGQAVATECHDPANDPICHPSGKVMLMWVGEKFYSAESFSREAVKLGISKRVTAIPKGLEIGKTWIALAHPKAITCPDCTGKGVTEEGCDRCGGKGQASAIFHAFIPSRLELILKQSDATEERIAEEKKRGVTVVAVPDDDKDHTEGNAFSDLAKRKREETEAAKKEMGLEKFDAEEKQAQAARCQVGAPDPKIQCEENAVGDCGCGKPACQQHIDGCTTGREGVA